MKSKIEEFKKLCAEMDVFNNDNEPDEEDMLCFVELFTGDSSGDVEFRKNLRTKFSGNIFFCEMRHKKHHIERAN